MPVYGTETELVRETLGMARTAVTPDRAASLGRSLTATWTRSPLIASWYCRRTRPPARLMPGLSASWLALIRVRKDALSVRLSVLPRVFAAAVSPATGVPASWTITLTERVPPPSICLTSLGSILAKALVSTRANVWPVGDFASAAIGSDIAMSSATAAEVVSSLRFMTLPFERCLDGVLRT